MTQKLECTDLNYSLIKPSTLIDMLVLFLYKGKWNLTTNSDNL